MKAGEKRRVSARCGWCCPSCRRRPRRAATTSWPCCAASASAGSRPRSSSATAAGPSWPSRRRAEAELIEAYLPAELDDAELDAIVAAAIAETGASSPEGHGPGDEGGDGAGGGPRRRQARLGAGAGGAEGA